MAPTHHTSLQPPLHLLHPPLTLAIQMHRPLWPVPPSHPLSAPHTSLLLTKTHRASPKSDSLNVTIYYHRKYPDVAQRGPSSHERHTDRCISPLVDIGLIHPTQNNQLATHPTRPTWPRRRTPCSTSRHCTRSLRQGSRPPRAPRRSHCRVFCRDTSPSSLLHVPSGRRWQAGQRSRPLTSSTRLKTSVWEALANFKNGQPISTRRCRSPGPRWTS